MPPKGNKKPPPPKDKEYLDKRTRNNEAVKKSRDKAKAKAEETMKKVQDLREGNKKLEGKIEQQKQTKKMLKNLFLEQTTRRMEKPTAEQLAMLEESDDDKDEFVSTAESSSSDLESSDPEPPPPKQRRKVKA